eukprot:TRINITY_DN28680_c1_g1_i1.p1 TRINITY_DN28680_c1_g1~~TRINITY_DN28680_c1_g1_i1.p1  ORF type:complete len:130 (-),score=18.28 TRINITY_DN28680_c1_g1_i1:17-355(-)
MPAAAPAVWECPVPQLFPQSEVSVFSVPSALSQPPPALFRDQLLGRSLLNHDQARPVGRLHLHFSPSWLSTSGPVWPKIPAPILQRLEQQLLQGKGPPLGLLSLCSAVSGRD